jgi:antitoxin component YwqK of YwqJK toxin-antitoxin module
METKVEREYWDNGQLRSEATYVGGERHGLTKWWWSNGQLRLERAYVDGVRHGMEKWWWPDGELGSENRYVDGKRHGMSKCWDRNGGVWFYLYNQGEQVAKFYPRNQTQRWKLK